MKLTFKEFEALVEKHLVYFRGEAHRAFRESLIFNLLEVGYSAHRAAQVVDAAEERFRP